MDVLWHILLLVFGFVLLIKGADFFVSSSSSIARKRNISPLIIGLTLVAFGTSLPELAVSFVASLTVEADQTSDIAMGNVVGSNIVNITLILGLTALFKPVPVSQTMHKKEFPLLIISSFLLLGLAFLFQSDYMITWWESIILLMMFIYYVYLVVTNKNQVIQVGEIKIIGSRKSLILLILGIIGVSFGGYLVTQASEYIAIELLVKSFNMTLTKATTLVGLSIVAVGTSLPEMVTSIVAAKKGENEIAFGNIVGSNIFNALFIIGFSGLFSPLGINQDVLIDMMILIPITGFALIFSISKTKVTKSEGIILILIYMSYLTYILLRALYL